MRFWWRYRCWSFSVKPTHIALACGLCRGDRGLAAIGEAAACEFGIIKAVSWFLFLPIALVEFLPPRHLAHIVGWSDVANSSRINQFALLGLSYCAIRSFLAVREGLARRDFRLMPAVTALVFFGTYVAGPIAGSNYYVAEARAKQSACTMRRSRLAALVGVRGCSWSSSRYIAEPLTWCSR